MKIDINCETGEVTTSEYSAEELANFALIQKELEDKQVAEKIELATKAAAKQALLDKLGITQEEANLLLGGN